MDYDLAKVSKKAAADAIAVIVIEIDEWRKAEMAKIADASLEGLERRKAELEVLMEVGRRYKKGSNRAKYQNSQMKVFERMATEDAAARD